MSDLNAIDARADRRTIRSIGHDSDRSVDAVLTEAPPEADADAEVVRFDSAVDGRRDDVVDQALSDPRHERVIEDPAAVVGGRAEPAATAGRWMAGRWMSIVAVVDQCLFSGTNFLTSVALGRFVGPGELGQYALAFSIVVIVVGLQRAVLMSPYLIVRGRMDRDSVNSLRAAMLIASMTMAAIGSTVALLGGWYASQSSAMTAGIWWATAVAFPAAMLRDFARRLELNHLRLFAATRIDLAVLVLQVSAIAWLHATGRLSAATMLAAASAIWALVGMVAILTERRRYDFVRPQLRRAAENLWPIGRWVSLTGLVVTAQSFLLPWVMAVAGSVRLAGIYAACWTLVQVVSPMIEGIGNLVGPKLAGTAEDRSWPAMYRLVTRTTAVFAVIMTSLMVGIVVLGRWALHGIYGEQYVSAFVVLLVLGLAATINNLGIPALKALVQLGHARWNFWISAIGFACTLVSAVGLLRWAGMAGAAWGLMIGNAVATGMRLWTFSRVDRTVPSSAQSPYRPHSAGQSDGGGR